MQNLLSPCKYRQNLLSLQSMELLKKIAFVGIVSLISVACERTGGDDVPDRYDDVVILYTVGYNNLSSDIQANIRTVRKSALPMKSVPKALVLVAHNAANDEDFNTPTKPVIVQIRSDWAGKSIMDTLKVLDENVTLLEKDVMSGVLSFICDRFKSDHYGLIFSSHGTGWLPEDYYRKPRETLLKSASDAHLPKTKTFGASYEGTPAYLKASHEMTLQDMAGAIPMHPDYIIFDACLMGGIETAYELRHVTDKIGFSQAQVLASGFDYSKLSECLLTRRSPEDFCKAFYDFYNAQSGSRRTATISLVDCSRLDSLATVCNRFFERYRSGIASVNPNKVQGFFTTDKHWFYDLEDIMVKAGISEHDLAVLSGAIDRCIIYKAHTDRILDSFDVKAFCGFSSYLPRQGSAFLDEYYKTLAWNRATGLVGAGIAD